MDLTLNDAVVEAAGVAIRDTGRAVIDNWSSECDLGDETLNTRLSEVHNIVNDSILGAAAQLFSLGQAVLDAVEAWRAH